MWRKISDEIGPIFGGYHIATLVVGFLSFGPIANWLNEYWFPLTRFAWQKLFIFLRVPDLPAAEKDSLTALLFFTPMAISSVYSWWVNWRDDRPRGYTPYTRAELYEGMRRRLYASIVGLVCIFIVGSPAIRDIFVLLSSTLAHLEQNGIINTVISPLTFVLLPISAFACFVFAVALHFSRESKKKASPKISALLAKLRFPQIADFALRKFPIANFFINIPFFLMFASTFAFAANQLGVIRTSAPAIIFVSFAITIAARPLRLIRVGGIVVLLVVSATISDAIFYIIEEVEASANISS